jgi:signal transduction histidine kinase
VRAIGATTVEVVRRTPLWCIDAALAVCFVVTGLTTTGRVDAGYVPRDAFATALILAVTLPYFGRRLAPLPVFAVSGVALATLIARGNAGGALPMAIAVGAYTVAAYRPWREVAVAAVLIGSALVVMLVADSPGFHIPEFVTSVAAFAATMLAGWTMQSRRIRVDALEREQEEASRRAAADERLRIAQELHDVVAHSLGVIAVQAGVGMHLIDTNPDDARRALEHISQASRSSLAEIRLLLGVVRAGEPAVTQPMPGLADLHHLVLDVGAAGLPVTLDVAGDAAHLPPGVELAAYRIVQEALTNTLRHAHADHAAVRVETQPGRLHICVSDDGRGDGDDKPGGNGLIGMRERVAVYGGSLTVGPAPGGGFRVDATIPYDKEWAL